jgi:hypothetical protein
VHTTPTRASTIAINETRSCRQSLHYDRTPA